MRPDRKILLALSLFILFGALLSTNLTDSEENNPLTISSLEEQNPSFSSFEKISGCIENRGTIRKSPDITGLRLVSFSDKIIGVQSFVNSYDKENKTLYFSSPPTKQECQTGKETGQKLNSTPNFSTFKSRNEELELQLTSEGSKICRPGIGKVWKSGQINFDIIEFDNELIGFKSGKSTLYLKDPPEAQECAKRNYLNDVENITGKEVWDLYSGSEKRVFYNLPKLCEEWYKYQGISSLSCIYTDKGIENVSIVTDPANFVRAPLSTENHSSSTIASDLGNSWDIEFLSDDTVIITQQDGEVLIKNIQSGEKKTAGKLDVIEDKMTGLMGVAVDPNYNQNNKVYLHYTYNYTEPYRNVREKHVYSKISSFKVENGKIKDEQVLLDRIPGHNFHTGGRLEFGPDNKLYATTGEASSWKEKPYNGQDPDSLNGKILRLNRDGSVPEDNPFNNSYVYSTGHRNPQGLAWQPETQTLYNTEHGTWRHDEINRVTPGSNYGWGRLICDKIRRGYIQEIDEAKSPIFCTQNWTLAPSGATFVNDPDHPWHGDLFVAGLRGKHVHRFSIDNGSVVSNDVFYIPTNVPGSERVRDIEYKDSSLWVLGDRNWMVKLEP